jgi:hypothetical protein
MPDASFLWHQTAKPSCMITPIPLNPLMCRPNDHTEHQRSQSVQRLSTPSNILICAIVAVHLSNCPNRISVSAFDRS